MSDRASLAIRPASSDDEPYLLPMIGALVEQEPNPNPGAFREALVSKTFLYSVDHPERGRVSVLPVYRRQGFALRVTKYLEAEANELGVNVVPLELHDGNEAAFELYRPRGFENHNGFLMTKWLQHPQ